MKKAVLREYLKNRSVAEAVFENERMHMEAELKKLKEKVWNEKAEEVLMPTKPKRTKKPKGEK